MKAFGIILILLAVGQARADSGPGREPYLPLTAVFSPTVEAFSGDAAGDLDEDCLDDGVEHELAMRYRPMFVFDSRENALRADEPLTLYQVSTGRKRPDCSGIRRVVVTYAYLLRDDGGYANNWYCGDAHRGDNQSVTYYFDVISDAGKAAFVLAEIVNGNYTWPTAHVATFDGSHPLIYLSAGKHHPFFDSKDGNFFSPYSRHSFCRDSNDGRGAHRLAVLDDPRAPRGRLNVGERAAHPRDAFVNGLSHLGFAGEDAWGTGAFCGGYERGCTSEVQPNAAIWR